MKVQASKKRNAKATYVVWKSKATKEESQSHQGVKDLKVPMVNAKVTIASMKVKTNKEKKILKLHVDIKTMSILGWTYLLVTTRLSWTRDDDISTKRTSSTQCFYTSGLCNPWNFNKNEAFG